MPYQGVALFVILGVGIAVAAFMYLSREQERLEQPYGYSGYDDDPPRLPIRPGSLKRRRSKKNISNGSATVCAVCIEEINEGGSPYKILRCRHVFHVQCIDRWATSKRECPVCRAKF